MIYNIHAGHAPANGTGCGAVSILNESIEDRAVKNALVKYLKDAGHTVYDCTCDTPMSAGAVLSDIVSKCNKHSVDLDISIHLNSGRDDYIGDGSTGGVEVYGYDNGTKTIGTLISAEIANVLNIRNRGFKLNQSLYVLRNTKSQAILIECCFVDDADDARLWNANKCAQAIFRALTGTNVGDVTINKYNIGQHVIYSSSYTDPEIPVGLQHATGGAGKGMITAIVSGQAKYQLDTGVYVNDGDIRGLYEVSTATYYPAYTGNSISLVDALKAIGTDGSYSARKQIAEKNGIYDYLGTEKQNTKLLTLLKAGKLLK